MPSLLTVLGIEAINPVDGQSFAGWSEPMPLKLQKPTITGVFWLKGEKSGPHF